ncbi:unnamed protein product, partial [Rotaria sp. Silwood1]
GQLLSNSTTNTTRHIHRLSSTTIENNSNDEIINKVVHDFETKI